MTDQHGTGTAGIIRDLPRVDLSQLTTTEELAGIAGLQDIGLVLVPESLTSALWRIPMDNVADVVVLPDGARARTYTGAVSIGGDALTDPGDNEVLLVTGSLVITSPVTQVGYRQLVVTGSVLAPIGSESPLGAGLTRVTGAVTYYPYVEGQNITMLSGDVKMTGESLANHGGTPDDILVIGGRLIVTTEAAQLGYRRIYVAGQLIAPRRSQAAIEPVIHVVGQTAWYGGDTPRLFLRGETFSKEFFELLDTPVTLVLGGDVDLEPDIPAALIKEVVAEIVVLGSVTASKALVPVIQLLAVEQLGTIQVRADGPGVS